jgi:hypothetical protein
MVIAADIFDPIAGGSKIVEGAVIVKVPVHGVFAQVMLLFPTPVFGLR